MTAKVIPLDPFERASTDQLQAWERDIQRLLRRAADSERRALRDLAVIQAELLKRSVEQR